MCSLAGALAGVQADGSLPPSSALRSQADGSLPPSSPLPSPVSEQAQPMSASSSAPSAAELPHGTSAPANAEVSAGEDDLVGSPPPAPAAGSRDLGDREGTESGDREAADDGSEPTWVECYHEVHDELWVERKTRPESPPPKVQKVTSSPDCHASAVASSSSAPSSSSAATAPGPSARHHRPGHLVTLGNFELTATQVPVAACISLPDESGTSIVEVSAVPSGWNPRFADQVTGRLAFDTENALGSSEWRVGKAGSVVILLRSSIQRTPATPDWATAVWLCHEAGALAAIVVNDLLDDGPSRPAFRMGLFGSPAPPIVAFMISGRDASQLCGDMPKAEAPSNINVTVQSVRPIITSLASSGGPPEVFGVPPWPLVLRMVQDVAQAWSLVETVHRAAPSQELEQRLADLADRMGLPEKLVWLTRRLHRLHRGDTDSDDPEEPQLAFVECDRQADQLLQLRRQLVERTGICAPDITGEFEVRFRDESSVGSAVMREWMDIVARQAFLPAAHHLLLSQDHGKTFMPDPAAPFLNRHWQGDFELLGRLLGLAIWQQVTLDLPLHPYVCKLLLHFDEEFEGRAHNMDEDLAELQRLDPDLCKNKVRWLLSNDISVLGYEMPFTDLLCCRAEGEVAVETDADLPAMEEVVKPSQVLNGDEHATEPLRLRHFDRSQVLLTLNGEDATVTEANKVEFTQRLLEWRLRESLRGPVMAMLRGVHAAVPPEVLAEARRMLTPEELCALLAGSRDIGVGDWERNTRTVGGLTANSQEVKWFWQTLRLWASDGRQHLLQNLLQFATGSRRVPVGGFAQLVGFNGGKHLFTLAKGVHLSSKSLPTSHACICTVDLPPWESAEAAAQKLLAAAEAGHTRFDEGMAHGD